jgi:hypothetical protein
MEGVDGFGGCGPRRGSGEERIAGTFWKLFYPDKFALVSCGLCAAC